MADLKSSKTAEEQVNEAADHAVQQATTTLQHEIAEALSQARQAAAALAQMPKESNDLLVKSELALSADFDVEGERDWSKSFVDVRFGGCSVQVARSDGRGEYLSRGGYRVLVFVLPISKRA